MYPISFRPKWRFIKSIPGQHDPELEGEDVEEDQPVEVGHRLSNDDSFGPEQNRYTAYSPRLKRITYIQRCI
jgi:hypothetical protein